MQVEMVENNTFSVKCPIIRKMPSSGDTKRCVELNHGSTILYFYA